MSERGSETDVSRRELSVRTSLTATSGLTPAARPRRRGARSGARPDVLASSVIDEGMRRSSATDCG